MRSHQGNLRQIKECESEEDISRINDQLSESSVQTALKSSGSTQRNTVPPVENVVGKINHPATRGHCAVAFFFCFRCREPLPVYRAALQAELLTIRAERNTISL